MKLHWAVTCHKAFCDICHESQDGEEDSEGRQAAAALLLTELSVQLLHLVPHLGKGRNGRVG